MTKLTEKQYWEEQYTSCDSGLIVEEKKYGIKSVIKKLIGQKIMSLFSSYDEWLLWEGILPKYLDRKNPKLKVLEIGSAPGDFLVRIKKEFGSDVFGVEYTSSGANVNREKFKKNNIDINNVIQKDFFSNDFLIPHGELFDIVISRGFIEHFDNVEAVIEKHLQVLKPGGIILVMIPNLQGVYGLWTKVFNSTQIPLHNLSIMKLKNYSNLFNFDNLKTIRCSYFGTFSFWLFTAPVGSRMVCIVIRILLIIQRGLNLIFRLLLRGKGCETSLLSPNLIYIGKKKL